MPTAGTVPSHFPPKFRPGDPSRSPPRTSTPATTPGSAATSLSRYASRTVSMEDAMTPTDPHATTPRYSHSIYLVLIGDPIPKARPRVVKTKTGQARTYTPHHTVLAQMAWVAAWKQSGLLPLPPKTPLRLAAWFYLRRPPSLPKRIVRPISWPDFDNLVKLATDALEGLAFENDGRIATAHIYKRFAVYPDPPRTVLSIRVLD